MYDIISLVIGIFFVIFSVIMLNNIDIIKERTVTGRYSSYTFKRSSAKLHLIILMILGILMILFNFLLNGFI
jgi:uncharacterized membrane protein